MLKAAFGFGVGCGLYALVAKAINPSLIEIADHDVFAWAPTLGGAIGAVYGAFVELDDCDRRRWSQKAGCEGCSRCVRPGEQEVARQLESPGATRLMPRS